MRMGNEPVNFAIDDYTNHFLATYPVYCEFRTIPLDQEHQLLHSHNGYEIYLVLQGTGTYIVGDRLYPLHAGSLTIIHPNVIHRPFHGHSKEFHRYVFSIDESYLDQLHTICKLSDLSIPRLLAERHPDSSHFFLSAPQLDRVQTLLTELTQALVRQEMGYELAVLRCIADFFLFSFGLQNEYTTTLTTGDHYLARDVLSYLIAHYQEPLHIEDLVTRFPVSRSQLFTLFKETTGTTIKQFLIEYRLNKAKRLLMESDLAISEVSAAVGFGDMSHFFHVFKKETGLTPKQYRVKAFKRNIKSN
ncbi:helix-turn-helix domain-containing protein [Paenibacillus sp. LMG 31461]|uniref:Helix-turn-helix domain-containing protein n=1 Tax=Paenibacillus plantarum TaxID=2654975 RepID=A0ABX1XBC0_9BACL|nr:AraC family transcriptional regulator [Paenibacillus plantarum]NOU65740.1 helix-turn-helix domain-containing protein [Paenibacillus plantarum]